MKELAIGYGGDGENNNSERHVNSQHQKPLYTYSLQYLLFVDNGDGFFQR